MTHKVNHVGQTFGRLTVLREHAGPSIYGYRKWECRCSCGADAVVSGHNLRAGNTRSCGCLRREVSAERARQMHAGAAQ